MRRYLFYICLLIPMLAFSQHNDRYYMRQGNRAYRGGSFKDAEVLYRKAMAANAANARNLYNLGNSLLRQQKPKDAMKMYEKAIPLEKNKFFQAQMYHNMGVILQSQKQFGPAIECYKEALRRTPQDDATRYNMVLCQRQLKNQPKNNQKQNQQNKQQKQQQKKDQNQQQKQQQQKQNQQNQQQDRNQMSKENAEQLLNAAKQEEKATQQKVKQAMQQPRSKKLDKNW